MCRFLSSTYLFEKGKLDVVVINFENDYAERVVELYIVFIAKYVLTYILT